MNTFEFIEGEPDEAEHSCGYNTVSGAFHKPGCTGDCGIMNPGDAVKQRRIQRRRGRLLEISDARVNRLSARIAELEAQLAKAVARANMWEHNYAISSPKRHGLIQRAEAAEKRVATLEAELGEASQLLDEPIGYNVGILCVAEAVRVVLTWLAEAKREIGDLTFAAHMPPDYPYGLPSWINQRLYAAYIHQARNQKEWDALKRALDAKEKAEAQLVETERLAETRRKLLEISDARTGRLSERLEAAEKKLADEREFAETLQEECDKAVDDMEAANSRAEKAEADAGRLRAALREAIGELQVIEKRATRVVGLAAYDIEHIAAEARKSAAAALSPAEQAEPIVSMEGGQGLR